MLPRQSSWPVTLCRAFLFDLPTSQISKAQGTCHLSQEASQRGSDRVVIVIGPIKCSRQNRTSRQCLVDFSDWSSDTHSRSTTIVKAISGQCDCLSPLYRTSPSPTAIKVPRVKVRCSGQEEPNWVRLVNHRILLCLDHLALVLVFCDWWGERGLFSIVSSSGSRLILCSIVRMVLLDWLTNHSVSVCVCRGRGKGSKFFESVRLVAFELLQLLVNLCFGVPDLVLNSVSLLFRKLPWPVVL